MTGIWQKGKVKRPKRKRRSCPCQGQFSEWDHKMLRDGETCKTLVEKHKQAHVWLREFRSRVARENGLPLLPEMDLEDHGEDI